MPDDEVCVKTGDILHVSRSSLRKIVIPDEVPKGSETKSKGDSFDKEYIRRTVHNRYA